MVVVVTGVCGAPLKAATNQKSSVWLLTHETLDYAIISVSLTIFFVFDHFGKFLHDLPAPMLMCCVATDTVCRNPQFRYLL